MKTPTILNPEAVGDPEQVPVVGLPPELAARIREEHGAPPKPNASRPVWELVIQDVLNIEVLHGDLTSLAGYWRDAVRRERYRTPLRATTDASQSDAFEGCSTAVYLRQDIEGGRGSMRSVRDPVMASYDQALASAIRLTSDQERGRAPDPHGRLRYIASPRSSGCGGLRLASVRDVRRGPRRSSGAGSWR
jgi:hypothetical protein